MRSISSSLFRGIILAVLLSASALAVETEITAGPGVLIHHFGNEIGLMAGLGLQKSVTPKTDIGFILGGQIFNYRNSTGVSASLQLRQELNDRLGLLLGVGGLFAQSLQYYSGDWDGYFYPTAGITYKLNASTLEARYSFGDKDALFYDYDTVCVGLRIPVTKLQEQSSAGSESGGSSAREQDLR